MSDAETHHESVVTKDTGAPFTKGGKAGPGRIKGIPNKVTLEVKEMVVEALNQAHPKGGIAYLVEQSQRNPAAFLALVAKCMPRALDVSLDNRVTLTLDRSFVRAKPSDLNGSLPSAAMPQVIDVTPDLPQSSQPTMPAEPRSLPPRTLDPAELKERSTAQPTAERSAQAPRKRSRRKLPWS